MSDVYREHIYSILPVETVPNKQIINLIKNYNCNKFYNKRLNPKELFINCSCHKRWKVCWYLIKNYKLFFFPQDLGYTLGQNEELSKYILNNMTIRKHEDNFKYFFSMIDDPDLLSSAKVLNNINNQGCVIRMLDHCIENKINESAISLLKYLKWKHIINPEEIDDWNLMYALKYNPHTLFKKSHGRLKIVTDSIFTFLLCWYTLAKTEDENTNLGAIPLFIIKEIVTIINEKLHIEAIGVCYNNNMKLNKFHG